MTYPVNQIYLASRSPRRRQLLKQIGINFEMRPVSIDEMMEKGETPTDYVCRMARAKATTIRFRDISQSEITNYLNGTESHDRAGSYAMQGRAAVFIIKISGSYSGALGLPIFETAQLLEKFNIKILQQVDK